VVGLKRTSKQTGKLLKKQLQERRGKIVDLTVGYLEGHNNYGTTEGKNVVQYMGNPVERKKRL